MVSTDVATLGERVILLVEIGGQRYGLLAADVHELVRVVTIFPLPKAPAIVEGLVNVRGTIVPVLDIRTRFRLPARSVVPSDHLVLAQALTRVVAIRVDRAIELLSLNEGHFQAARSVVPDSQYAAGVAKLPDGLVVIHDLATFLNDAEGLVLDDALRSSAGADP
jgi:purine-binding chemotaxis protein CheW